MSKVGQPMSNSWSTSSQPDFVRALGRRKTVRKSPKQDFVHRVAQKLANSWSTLRQLPTPWEVAGVFLAIVLWQHPIHNFPNRSPCPREPLHRSSESQIAARSAAFRHTATQTSWPVFLVHLFLRSQHFRSERLQDVNASESQTPACCQSQWFGATRGRGFHDIQTKTFKAPPQLLLDSVALQKLQWIRSYTFI